MSIVTCNEVPSGMKIWYTKDVGGVWLSALLIVVAKNIEEAKKLILEQINSTPYLDKYSNINIDTINIIEVDMTKSSVVIADDGDY